METFQTDVIVIGAGVVGLAVAAALARQGRDILVVEAETQFGSGISSRNSEVIHAGVYYSAGSLKARLCVEGRDRLYAYCRDRGIGHAACGKLIVAVGPDEVTKLEGIEARANQNGSGLHMIDGAEAHRLEPALSSEVSAALLSPRTGIVDSHGLMIALTGELEDHGGMIAFGTSVTGGEDSAHGHVLHVSTPTPAKVEAKIIINAAGLWAIPLARQIEGPAFVRKPRYAKGSYYSYGGRNPFRHLIYPTPVDGGLGVHLTFDLGGAARFGPDVEWLDAESPQQINYDVDPGRLQAFEAAIRRYWSDVDISRLSSDYSGVRPKLSGPGEPPADFDIRGHRQRDQTRIHLMGIESPGLTASLAIGAYVAAMLDR